MPYSCYEQFDFEVPVGHFGDNYDRFKVRMDEMRQSIKIVEQALDGLPEGPFITANRKVALPPRHELATSMEALIHHFKLVTEGFRVPPGEAYVAIESPRGELGCYVLADGSAKPARVHMRDPSFVNLQSLPDMARDSLIADFIACVAMLDPILGEDRWTTGLTRPAPARLGRGRSPRRGPGDRPRPRVGRRAGRAARRDRGATWPSTPSATRRRCRRWPPPSACTAGARPRRSTRWRPSCR